MPSPTGASLGGVWGAGDDDLWAAGGSELIRWNGSAWTVFATPDAGEPVSFHGLWGAAANDIWALGRTTSSGASVAAHFDGARWTVSPMGVERPLKAIHGSGGQFWVAGEGGAVLRRP